MGIYDNTVYFHVCVNCGSLDWEEYTDGVENDYTTNEDGETVNFNEDYYGDVVDVRCHDCEKNTVHELAVDKSYWKKILDMDGENRLIYIIKLMSEGKMEKDEDFIEDVVFYHENDREFMKRISEYLQTLGYTEITG